MKVFVIGASGRVGRELVGQLAAQGNEVLAGCRKPDEGYWPADATPVEFDLHWDASQMIHPLEGCDAVCFVAGSRGKDLLRTDAFGAVKAMQAAEIACAKRFVLLSSYRALEPARWKEVPSLARITDYNIAKFFADSWLIGSTHLDWTIIQPGVLEEKPGIGKVAVDPSEGGPNPIPDVAAMLAGALAHPNTIGRVIMMHSGDTPIDKALSDV